MDSVLITTMIIFAASGIFALLICFLGVMIERIKFKKYCNVATKESLNIDEKDYVIYQRYCTKRYYWLCSFSAYSIMHTMFIIYNCVFLFSVVYLSAASNGDYLLSCAIICAIYSTLDVLINPGKSALGFIAAFREMDYALNSFEANPSNSNIKELNNSLQKCEALISKGYY